MNVSFDSAACDEVWGSQHGEYRVGIRLQSLKTEVESVSEIPSTAFIFMSQTARRVLLEAEVKLSLVR